MRLDIKCSDLAFRSGSASAFSENWWCLSELVLTLFPINPMGAWMQGRTRSAKRWAFSLAEVYLFAGKGLPLLALRTRCSVSKHWGVGEEDLFFLA